MKIFAALLLVILFTTHGYTDVWSPIPPNQVPSSSTTGSGVYSSCNTTVGNFLVTWADNYPSDLPIYTIFDGSTWTTPSSIPSSSPAQTIIASSFNSGTGTFLVTWGGIISPLGYPFYATFDGSTWSTPAQIPSSSSLASAVFSAVNPSTGTFLAVWMDGNSTNPYYATFDGTSWSTPAQIPGSQSADTDIFVTFDPTSGLFLVSWLDGQNFPPYPYYATFDGTSWSTPGAIPGSSPGSSDVMSSVNSSGTFLLTWIDESSGAPVYVTFNGTSWSTPTLIPCGTVASSDISSSYDSNDNVFVVTWAGITAGGTYPSYTVFDGTNWSTPATIPGTSQSNYDITPSYCSSLGEFLVTWQGSNVYPYYSALSSPKPLISLVKSAIKAKKAN